MPIRCGGATVLASDVAQAISIALARKPQLFGGIVSSVKGQRVSVVKPQDKIGIHVYLNVTIKNRIRYSVTFNPVEHLHDLNGFVLGKLVDTIGEILREYVEFVEYCTPRFLSYGHAGEGWYYMEEDTKRWIGPWPDEMTCGMYARTPAVGRNTTLALVKRK